ncbi:MAG: triphosphoribosyl-dephospho-CoA synthase CitG [Eubacteriales bacterium]|nr:triphosphoribosyl-dephospho-CoA synthase CitG [Eubacteriales bacterium]
MNQSVELYQMLEARERRAFAQQRLLAQFHRPVLCFTMNIPGPVKDTPLIRRAFLWGREALEHRLPKGSVLFSQVLTQVTGCEAVYAVDMEPVSLKRLTTSIEDETPLGRLFDMDVLDISGVKLDRALVAGKSRDCIVCGAPGRGCASRRSHSIAELQRSSNRLMRQHFAQADAERIGALATQSLLDEVCTTPKPGLVDRRNSGSHRDMDIFTFMASAAALSPYFTRCAQIGMDTGSLPPEETFRRLRAAGLRAEQEMYAATGGVNTHKGAIFTMGILCGAAGRLWDPAAAWAEGALFDEVSAMTKAAMAADLSQKGSDTVGRRLYAKQGICGIRGEVARGLPSVRTIGLPAFRAYREAGQDPNMAGALTLLHLIAQVEDTNMIARGGREGAAQGAAWAGALLRHDRLPTPAELEELDSRFIRQNLSPGGCADLLAAVYFVDRLSSEKTANP